MNENELKGLDNSELLTKLKNLEEAKIYSLVNSINDIELLERVVTLQAENKLFFRNVFNRDDVTTYIIEKSFETTKDNDMFSKIAVLKNTPKYILDELAFEEKGINDKVNIQELVASNPNTSSDALTYLSTNKNINVRKNVLMNESISKKTMEDMFKGPSNIAIRNYIVENKNCNSDFLNTIYLNNMDSKIMKDKILNHPNCFNHLIEQNNRTQLEKDLEKKYGNILERVALAKDTNTSIEVLRDLASENDFLTIMHIVENPNVDYNLVRKISNECKHDDLDYKLSKIEKVPQDVLFKIAERTDEDSIKTNIIFNNNVSKDILKKFSEDENYQVASYATKKLNESLDMSKLNDQMSNIGSNEVEHTSTNKNHHKH